MVVAYRRQEFLPFNFRFAFFLAACFSVHVLLPGFSRLHLVPLCNFTNYSLLLPHFALLDHNLHNRISSLACHFFWEFTGYFMLLVQLIFLRPLAFNSHIVL